MIQKPIKQDKNTRFLLSEQVKNILQKKGYLKVFNYSDYHYYKNNLENAFNKAFAIAELFILDNETECDFNEYLF